MKKYAISAFIYTILATIGGVFYREFTKAFDFTGRTTLGFVHTHYLALGLLFFLLLLILEKLFSFSNKKTKYLFISYHIGLNLTCIMLIVRGIFQVLQTSLSNGMNQMISGIAGIGHIILGVSLILFILQIMISIIHAEKKA